MDMLKINLLIIYFFISIVAFPQVIKINNGFVISSFEKNSNYNIQLLPDKQLYYSFTFGLNYCEHKYYYLSSEVGYIGLGGKQKNATINFKEVKVSELWHYMHINTTLRLRYPIKEISIFIGAGPNFDFLIGNDKFKSNFFDIRPDFRMKNVLYGLKLDIGVEHELNRLLFSLNSSCYFNFSNSGTGKNYSFKYKIFEINFSVGYRLFYNK